MVLDEIKQFRTRSPAKLREMMLLLSEVLKEDIVKKVKKSGSFGIHLVHLDYD